MASVLISNFVVCPLIASHPETWAPANVKKYEKSKVIAQPKINMNMRQRMRANIFFFHIFQFANKSEERQRGEINSFSNIKFHVRCFYSIASIFIECFSIGQNNFSFFFSRWLSFSEQTKCYSTKWIKEKNIFVYINIQNYDHGLRILICHSNSRRNAAIKWKCEFEKWPPFDSVYGFTIQMTNIIKKLFSVMHSHEIYDDENLHVKMIESPSKRRIDCFHF